MQLARVSKALNYTFNNIKLAKQALTHRSANINHNERLEFLGDSVLNFVISKILYKTFPERPEGELSRLRAHLVKEATLHTIALDLQLGDALILGQGELKSGGFRRASILSDTLEALFGAILLDSDFLTCENIILSLYKSRIQDPLITENLKDPKTRLQEYLQGNHLPLPEYKLQKITGEEHDQIFYVNCTITKTNICTEGKSSNRRKAEQIAARKALKQIETNNKLNHKIKANPK